MVEFTKPPKTLVYINGYAALTVSEEEVSRLLKEKTDPKDIFIFRNDVRNVPAEIYSTIGKVFYNGMCSQQMTLVRDKDGIFINPFLLGFTTDYAVWVNEIADSKDSVQIIYLDVPYELYFDLVPLKAVNEDEYELNSVSTQKLVNAIKESIKESTVYH